MVEVDYFELYKFDQTAEIQQKSCRGDKLREEGMRALSVSLIRSMLSVVFAAGRRRKALEQERLLARERRADSLATGQGFNLIRQGFT